jgi:pimeloyl-ACP methyl ester carboxylesterase
MPGSTGPRKTPPHMTDATQTLRIDTGEINLSVRSSGAGPAVLLLHGFPDSCSLWDAMTPALVAAGYRVLAPDLRGFGDSDAPRGVSSYRMERIVADLCALLDQACPGEPVRVIGHDWGAVVAWAFAMAHPQRTLASVAISVGHPREYALGGLEQKRKGLYTLYFQARGLAEAVLSRNDHAVLRRWAGQHPDIEHSIRLVSRPGRLTAGLNWYRANLLAVLFGAWPQCAVPTLGIWSSGDRYLSEDQMERSRRRMTAPWHYVRICDAGHWLPLEQPARMAELALDWFARHAPPTERA